MGGSGGDPVGRNIALCPKNNHKIVATRDRFPMPKYNKNALSAEFSPNPSGELKALPRSS